MGEGGGGVGVRGGGVWGESVELQRFILFICILSLFSVRGVIPFSSIVMLFYKRFLAPPPPRAPSLPPQYLSVLYSLTVFYQSKLISCYVMCWAVLFAFMKVKSCYFPFELFCVSY